MILAYFTKFCSRHVHTAEVIQRTGLAFFDCETRSANWKVKH